MINIYKLVVIFIIGMIIGAFIGFEYSMNLSIRKIVQIIPVFANITVDYQIVNEALYRYSNNIGNLKCTST